MRTGVVQKLPIVLVAALAAVPVLAGPVTIATFDDPAAGGNTPLFELSTDPNDPNVTTLSGGWGDEGLDLVAPYSDDVFLDATFVMTDVDVLDANGTLSDGTIKFFDNNSQLVLQIDFDAGALFQPFGFGASALLGHNVTFSGPIIPSVPLTEESFSFSFANQVETTYGYTWTAAFTSSAVPAPATLVLLAVGSIAAGCSRRRHAA